MPISAFVRQGERLWTEEGKDRFLRPPEGVRHRHAHAVVMDTPLHLPPKILSPTFLILIGCVDEDARARSRESAVRLRILQEGSGVLYLILLYVQEEAKIPQNTLFHEQPFSVLPHISYCISRGCRRPAEYQRIALSDMRH